MIRFREKLVLRGFVLLLIVNGAFHSTFAQNSTTESNGNPALHTEEVLRQIDKLVEQNRQLENANRELMIRSACFGRRCQKGPRRKAVLCVNTPRLAQTNQPPRCPAVPHHNKKSLRRAEVLRPILKDPSPRRPSTGVFILRTEAFASPTRRMEILTSKHIHLCAVPEPTWT